jgi:formylmethanofuran dehydrogenase subunit D
MKQAVCVIASVLCLAACNKGPQVSLKNATGNQVAQAVRQSGVMTGDTMIQPGLWQSKVTVQEMNFPGMPAQYLDKMKQSIAEHRNEGSKHCITEADVKKPKEDFFGADKSCKYDHFTMGGGKIDIAMVCHNEDATQTMSGNGSYTPTSYSIDTAMSETGGHENGMAMKMHVDAQRVGACPGKDDEG